MIGALYGNALSTGHGLHAIYPDGRRVVLPVGSWNGGVELPGDRSLLGRCWGPTLDVGCGPGRLLVALGVRGVPAAGIDPSEEAVALARRAGGTAVCRSVFAPLPGEGLWSCAVLADGTIGIGGAPVRLLSRVRELLGTDGRVLVELDPPASPSGPVRLRLASHDEVGEPFDWAHLSVRDIGPVAAQAGLTVDETWTEEGRWFASLHRA